MMICSNKISRCFVSPPIGQALAADAFECRSGTFGVAMAGLNPFAINLHAGFAMVIAEVKLGRIALQVLRANMVKRADNTALENRKVVLSAVLQ